MAAPFPHRYQVGLRWTSGREGVLSAPPRPDIAGGPPPQFDGKDAWWGPEHLLLASVSLCYMTTFFVVAEKARLTTGDFRVEAEGVLNKTEAGIAFTSITLNVSLKVPSGDEEKARRLMETAKKHCIVSNTLKPVVDLKSNVSNI